MRAWVIVYLKGVCMGAADIVPGVSGGTIALIVGIYDRLVAAIASLDPRALGHLRRLHTTDGRGALLDASEAMDLPFLVVLGAGIGTAVLVVSRVILFLFRTYPALINAFFFGLIGASALLIFRDVQVNTAGRAFVGIVGFLLAFVIAGLATGQGTGGSLPIVFAAGAIAISAMILPGISGAAFLYILGQYDYLLAALWTFIDAVSGRSTEPILESGIVVGTFLVGAVLGLLTTARIVSWALRSYRMATLVFLVSLMAGALRMPVEEAYAVLGIPGIVDAVGLILAAGVGAIAILVLDQATGSLDYV